MAPNEIGLLDHLILQLVQDAATKPAIMRRFMASKALLEPHEVLQDGGRRPIELLRRLYLKRQYDLRLERRASGMKKA